MRLPPEPLWNEEQKLADRFFSRFPVKELERIMTEEEQKEMDRAFDRWMKKHASEELKLWWDYTGWVGDEGQLCDGKGHSLGSGRAGRIREWDVSAEGFCLVKGTDILILNTDGTPIKNPVPDRRLARLLEND